MKESLKSWTKKIFNFRCLSGSTLKIIACVSMVVDHFFHMHRLRYVDYILDNWDFDAVERYLQIYRIGRGIGRLAFPIYCFLLVEGFFHTKNLKKYLLRLFVMAILSEHAFNLLATGNMVDLDFQNVFLTLFIALLTICGMNKVRMRTGIPGVLRAVFMTCIAAAGCAAAYFLKTDYDYNGVLSIVIIYLLHFNRPLTCIGGALSFAWERIAPLSFIPIFLYDGRRGLKAKYFFYFFYPAHIYLLYIIVYHILPVIYGIQ